MQVEHSKKVLTCKNIKAKSFSIFDWFEFYFHHQELLNECCSFRSICLLKPFFEVLLYFLFLLKLFSFLFNKELELEHIIDSYKRISFHLYEWNSTVSRLQNHDGEAVYFLPLSPPKFLALVWLTSEGWKAVSTLEPPIGFELRTPEMGVQRLEGFQAWTIFAKNFILHVPLGSNALLGAFAEEMFVRKNDFWVHFHDISSIVVTFWVTSATAWS